MESNRTGMGIVAATVPPPALDAARHWFVLLRDDAVSAADRDGFAAWLAADPANPEAWRQTVALWDRMDGAVPTLLARDGNAGGGDRAGLSRRRWLQQAAAAALVLGGGAAYVATAPDLYADYTTAVGERRSIALADGSTVDLAPGSALSATIDAGRRRLTLHAGEAFFRVAADPVRPFVVSAANGEITALGTAFDVKRLPDGVRVAVTEHAVLVAVRGQSPVRLAEGYDLQYRPDGIDDPRPSDAAAVLAWRRDRLFFQDAPLGEVVADLGRYRRGHVLILGDDLRRLPVTGFFHTSQSDSALQTIATTLPVRVTSFTDRLIIIRPQ